MKSFDTRTYSISDFAEWNEQGVLELSAKFQRRAVWTTKAKSYLIDTIIRGKPMPKVLITQELIDGRMIRTVVDGQQRLRAIIEFMQGSFAMLRTHYPELAGKTFENLPDDIRSDFWKYEIGVDVLFDTTLSDVLDIFARLNTYSVKLNQTELLNAQYLGSFKTTCHRLGHKYAWFWNEAKILTDSQISRMAEVELTADLIGALLMGISSKKQIPMFYKRFDDSDIEVEAAANEFEQVMSFIGTIYSTDDLSQTNFHRVHLFYSLFLSLSNLLVGRPRIGGLDGLSDSVASCSRIRVVLDDISAEYDIHTQPGYLDGETSTDMVGFIEGSRRATTDQVVRENRSRFLSRRIRT